MAWLTWRQHRPQFLATAGLLLLLAIAALVTALPIRAAYHRHALSSCLPPSTRSGCEIIVSHFRSEFAARAAGDALPDRAPGAGRALHRRPAAGARVRVRDVPAGLDAEPLAPALGALAHGGARARDRRRGRAPVAADDVVAQRRSTTSTGGSARTASTSRASWCRPTPSSRWRWACWRACCCAARSPRCRSRSPSSSRFASASRSSCDRTTWLPAHRTVDSLAPSAGARDWILENRLVDAVGRQHLDRARGSRDRARAARARRSAGLPALARLAPRDHLPAERPLLDVPGDRAGLFVALGVLAVVATLALAQRATA